MTVFQDIMFTHDDVEVTKLNEYNQLSAVTTSGTHKDLSLKTSTRKKSSPIVGKLLSLVYMIITTEPTAAMRAFMEWVRNVHRKNSGSAGVEHDVVLVTHNGMNHGHVLLLKTMLVRGINPRFPGSLPKFKLVVQPGGPATLD